MADNSADVVLRARLGLLRGSLLTVQRALTDIEACRTGARLGPADPAADAAGGGPAGGAPPGGPPAPVTARVAATIDVATVARDLRVEIASLADPDVRARLSDLAGQLVSLAELRPEPVRPRLLALDKTSIEQSLGDEATTALEDLDDADALLTRAVAEQDEATKDRLLGEAWATYRECQESCEQLFGEYVDMVRGVLLRDALFDQDLCRIADELVRLFGQVKEYVWNAFTIPSSSEQRDASFARVIRIGFPEWNVWTLPLTAHEFGHVFAARHEAMHELIDATAERGAVGAAEARRWVADAFATAVMGPAYVWAALLLRIDPTDELDRRRVMVMQLALAHLQDRPLTTYPEAAIRIAEAWSAALAQTGGWAPPPDAVVVEMRNVVDRVHRRVRDPFGAASWETALGLVDQLRDPARTPGAIAEGLAAAQLRHVLVAGWIARLGLTDQRPASAGEADAQHAAIVALAERVRLVCLALVDRAAGAAPAVATVRASYVAGAGMPAGMTGSTLPIDDKRADARSQRPGDADAVTAGLRDAGGDRREKSTDPLQPTLGTP